MNRSESLLVPGILAASIFLALATPAMGKNIHSASDVGPLSHSVASKDRSGPQSVDAARQRNAGQNRPNTEQKPEKPATTLKQVMVTGSLIPETEVQTSTPLITITSQQLQDEGVESFASAIGDLALSTGNVDSPEFTTGFTPGARTARLFGLPARFTLYMLDDKPIAPYPLPYVGAYSFTNLSNIPLTMIDRIEIVPGGQSSLYGSSAIAGVINIKLKKRIKGFLLSATGGEYTAGGGQMGRVSFAGGYNTDKLHVVYGAQVERRRPMFASQRKLTASGLSNPDPNNTYAWPAIRLHYTNMPKASYVDPNLTGIGCDAISYYAGGTVARHSRPNRGPNGKGPGYFCSSYTARGTRTLRNKKKKAAAYIRASYQVSPDLQVYASFLYDYARNQSNTGPGALGHEWAANDDSPIYNALTGRLDHYEVGFTAEEMGGVDAMYRLDAGHQWNGTLGVKGSFGSDSDWQYDGYLMRSDYTQLRNQIRPVTTKVNQFFENFFLGPQLGVHNGFPVYKPNDANFYKPITPEQFRGFSEMSPVHSTSWIQRAHFKLFTTDLFTLPAGPVGFAAVADIGGQRWKSQPDPRALQGYYWGWKGARGVGSRRHYDTGVEIRIPVFSMLTADVSGRYDHYKNVGGGSGGEPTYRVGLAFRPVNTLLLRANYATAFLAPDMYRSFEGPSESFNSTIDRYKCAKYEPNSSLRNCSWYSHSYRKESSGNPYLKPVTAKTSGFGAVWEPIRNLVLNADYYYASIHNRVVTQSTTRILQTEAKCRLGQLDIDSPDCVDLLQRVERGPATSNPNTTLDLQKIHVVPINRARERVWGVVAGLKYRFRAGKLGRFNLGFQYNTTLGHTYQEFRDSETVHYLHDPDLLIFYKTKAKAHVTWNIGKFAATLSERWSGSLPNHAANRIDGWDSKGAARLPPWIRYNLVLNYKLNPSASLKLAFNNITNKMPPPDVTYNSWPYYHYATQNLWGRFISLQVRFRLGRHGK